MAKNIIKEIIIILLLCLAIILVLGVLLYEYVPSAKVIPEKVSYTTPENVKEELKQVSDIDESQVIMTYSVDSSDLNNYKNIQDYKPGKTNPFASSDSGTQTAGGNTTTNGSSTGNTTSSGNTDNGSSSNSTSNSNSTNTSGGNYFQDKGTK